MGDAGQPGVETAATPYGREFRWLRFGDRELELTYREFHLERNLPLFRFLFVFVLAFQLVLILTGPTVDGLALSDARLWIRTAFGVAQSSVGFWAIRQPWFRRWGELYLVASLLVIGTFLALVFAANPLGFARMMTYLISTVILSRLRFRHAVVACVIEITVFTGRASMVLADARVLLPPRLASLFVTALLLCVASYLLEQSERRDFVLTRLLVAEQEKSERLLLNVLPPSIARQLKDDGTAQVAEGFDEVTVLFADIPEFTPNTARFGPRPTVRVLNDLFSAFDDLADSHGLEKIKTVGDAYMAVAGAPDRRPDHAEIAVAMALAMLEASSRVEWPGGEKLTLRIGLASGPAVAGVIGHRKFSYDVWGDTVNVASRLSGAGPPGALVMTEHTYALAPPGRGGAATAETVSVKGKGRMRVMVVQPRPTRPRARATTATRTRRAKTAATR